MIKLILKSLKSKNFYKTEYKKISRLRTFGFVVFISLLYALLTTPIYTYLSYTGLKNVKNELKKIPPKIEINYNKKEGLTTNVNSAQVININNNTLFVIDPKSNYTEYSAKKHEIILRNKGLLVYDNGRLVQQNSYKNLTPIEFKITGNDIYTGLDTISVPLFIIFAGIFNLAANFLGAVLSVLWVSVILGGVTYILNTILKRNITILQNIKKIFFLSIFLVMGMAINVIFMGTLPLADVILLGIGYLFLNRY